MAIATLRRHAIVRALYADATRAQLQYETRGMMQVNKIRESLHLIARNSSAFGLVQPHLERTRLCTLPDSELDPKYLRQREELREVVLRLAQPKVRCHCGSGSGAACARWLRTAHSVSRRAGSGWEASDWPHTRRPHHQDGGRIEFKARTSVCMK